MYLSDAENLGWYPTLLNSGFENKANYEGAVIPNSWMNTRLTSFVSQGYMKIVG